MLKRFFGPHITFAEEGAPSTPPPPAAQQPDPVQAAYQNLLQRGGGTDLVAWQLYQENHGHRETIRQLQSQLAEAQGKAAPAGATVLDADAGKRWAAYAELGQPEELKQRLGELATLRRDAELAAVAAAAGYSLDVLRDRDRAEGGLRYEVKDVQEAGKAVKKVFVLARGQDGAEQSVALDEYAKSRWATYLPILKAEANGARQGAGVGTPRREPPKQPETPAAPRKRLTL